MADDADAVDRKMNGSVVDEDGDTVGLDDAGAEPEQNAESARRPDVLRTGLTVGLAVIVALGGLAGWLGLRAHQSDQSQQQRELFLQVGRQGALNLTTIDYTRVDADIQRVLDSSTGAFHEDFQKRSPSFADVVKQAQSKSQGAITEAGLESVSEDAAQVLVAVAVTTSNLGAQDQQPRNWRMRIGVQQVGDGAKVSSVGFVP